MKKPFVSLSICALAALAIGGAIRAQEPATGVRWDFDNPREIVAATNIDNAKFENGEYSGHTKYDPYFSLALPAGGLDAKQLTVLKTRFYSSAPADALAVYYQAPNGDWAISAGPAIKAGWNEMTLDLNRDIDWAHGDAGSADKNDDAARAWGGREKRVTALRLDPGNQADRDIKFDYVALQSAIGAATKAGGTAAEKTPQATPDKAPAAPQAAGQSSWTFDRAGDFQGWKFDNFARLEPTATGLYGLTQYDPSLLSPETHIDAATHPIFEFKAKSDVGGNGEIFFRGDGETISELRMAHHSVVGDGKWHIYRVDMSTLPLWRGDIRQIRFDLLNAAGANIEVAYVRLLSADDSGNLLSNGSFENATGGVLDDWKVTGLQTSLPAAAPAGGERALQLSGAGTLTSARFDLQMTGAQNFSGEYSLPRGAAKLEVTAQFFDIFDKPLPKKISRVLALSSGAKWRRVATDWTAPPHAASSQITLSARTEKGAPLLLDKMALTGVKAEAIGFSTGASTDSDSDENGAPLWKASWLAPKQRTINSPIPRLFRRSFSVEDTAQIESARVLVTADNTARLFVNGVALPAGPFSENWREPDLYDIKSFLKTGKNVVAILTTNEGETEGMLAEVGVRRRDGKTTYLVSDAAWRAQQGQPPENWAATDFNDAKWLPAQVVATAGSQPWGRVPYVYVGAVTPIEVRDVQLPTGGELGSNSNFSATLVPRVVPSRPLNLVLEAVPQDNEKNATIFFSRALDTKNWKAGQPVKIGPLPVQLPRFTTPGNYTLRLRVPFAELSPTKSAPASTRVAVRGDWLEAPLPLTMKSAPKSPVARVQYLAGNVPSFVIDGKTFPTMHHMENEVVTTRSLDNIRNAGVPLMWLSFSDGFGWKPDGNHDFSAMDKNIARILERNPDTYLVINMPFDPVYNPAMREAWIKLHPNELVKDEKGNTDIGIYNGGIQKAQSYASRVWMDDATQSARALVKHVRSSPYAGRVIGYVPISGISWEWFYWGAQSQEFVDYSAPFARGFREYSQQKYGTITKLNAAWKTTYASFDEVPVPTREARLKSDVGLLLDPQKSAAVITLREYFSQVISGDILEMCHAIKQESNGDALTGTYYGYVTYVAGPYIGNNTGHFALSRVLASKDVDFLMSPSRYDDRGIGGGSGFMTTVDSFKLHNKIYIDQADIRTFRATGPGGQVGRTDTPRESAAVLMREAADAIVNGVAPQWYDFSLGWTTGDVRLMDVVQRADKIEAELQKVPRKTLDGRASIALIVDEKSVKYSALESSVQDLLTSRQLESFHRTGAGVDIYLSDDLEKMPPYKCYVFANTMRLTEAQRKYIDANLKKNGNTLVWLYAPGVTDDETLDFARASQVTGISLKADTNANMARALRTRENDALLSGVAADFSYGTTLPQGPQLYADDAGARVLAHLDGSERAGLVAKKFADWTSIYSATAPLPASLLRNIARDAGVQIVNPTEGDITYVSDRVFAVHTYGGGARTFSVPAKSGTVRELVRGESYEIKDGKFSCELPEKSTSIFLHSAP